MKDAHEFLCQVLDQLKDDIDKKNKEEANWKMQCLKGKLTTEKTEKEIVEEEKEKELSSDGSDAAAAAATETANTIKQEQTKKQKQEQQKEIVMNPVVDNFQFQVKHTVHCQK